MGCCNTTFHNRLWSLRDPPCWLDCIFGLISSSSIHGRWLLSPGDGILVLLNRTTNQCFWNSDQTHFEGPFLIFVSRIWPSRAHSVNHYTNYLTWRPLLGQAISRRFQNWAAVGWSVNLLPDKIWWLAVFDHGCIGFCTSGLPLRGRNSKSDILTFQFWREEIDKIFSIGFIRRHLNILCLKRCNHFLLVTRLQL